jgi:uncharacterized OB-fold protein
MPQNVAAAPRVLRAAATDTRIAFEDAMLSGDLLDLPSLRLAGSRCTECGIALWGVRRRCENCSSLQLREEAFSPTGTVYTYTIQRYAPPKPHTLPEPWQPRAVAWVDLDDGGPRVMAPLGCAAETVRIGMKVRLHCAIGFIDAQGREVVSYQFVAQDPS